jgi:hypothetical protein
MSARDYRALAEALRAVGSTGGDTGTLLAVAMRAGEVFKADNQAYKHEVFLEAAGLGQYEDVAVICGDDFNSGKASYSLVPVRKEG